MPPETLPIVLLALLVDAAAGYPAPIFRAIGHPVTWLGALIGALDRSLNRQDRPALFRRLAGVAAVLLVSAAAAGAGLLLQETLIKVRFGWAAIAMAAGTLIAARSLHTHVREVAEALEAGGLEAGRAAVSHIVGRDTHSLDEHGVARAAIESLAENASDGVAAPVFWFVLLGLPGIAAYKAINTADSMIGHRSAKYKDFGWAAARLDDLVNLPASRLTAMLFAAASIFAGTSPRAAVRAVFRDAPRHRSPNAGYPEAAMAGALGLRLGGPRFYGGALAEDAFMGSGRLAATAHDIRRSLKLAAAAWLIQAAGIGLLACLTLRF
ncbi:MAG TPA: adenosylcobinamide-phosphate synthase CbiB [Hyphomicrobiales bacterium]|nr:adenosylcobinamide-phosphate synthase CbiB [Hyphomicrobiales bacterium]